jgi:predicted AlkP superfamily pyrophosphatase or phosphodiesterase
LNEDKEGRLRLRLIPQQRATMPCLIILLLLFLAACGKGSPSAPSAQPTPAPTPAPRQVVIVSIDGLRPDALLKADAHNIQALAARGAYTWEARTIMPSNTLPSHVSMLTGYPPDMHRITWDDYLPLKGRLTVPTLFTAARAAGLHTTMVVGKNKFDYFKDTGAVETYLVCTGGDDDVAGQAVVQLATSFNLVFVHFPDVDLTGHSKNWMSVSYLDRVLHADEAVGRVLAAVPASATVIVTADHGGGGMRANNHGTDVSLDMTIPWVVSGPRTMRNYRLSSTVHTTDTAATAAYLLGITLPADVSGEPVTEAFLPGR